MKVAIGSSDYSIKRLHDAGELKHIDLMFLDHYKPAYRPDLKLCEELKLVTPGSVLAADNVITPGNPPYLEYVRASVEQKRKWLEQSNGTGADPDARVGQKHINQYAKRGESTALNTSPGNPNLVYESKLNHSFEPTGDPVGVWCSCYAWSTADNANRMPLRSPGAQARSRVELSVAYVPPYRSATAAVDYRGLIGEK